MPTTVTNQLVLEVDAETERLQAKLDAVQKEMQSLKRAGATEGIGAGVDDLGERYAKSGRKIAGAAEEMARMGEVGSTSIKHLITDGAEMALMFGTGGAVVGAIGIATVAIVELFTRSRKEMEETQKKFKEELDKMVNEGDSVGLKKRAHDLYVGTPAKGFTDGIAAAEREIAELRAGMGQSILDDIAKTAKITEIEKRIKPAREQFEALSRAIMDTGNALRVIDGMQPVKITADAPSSAKDLAQAAIDAAKGELELANAAREAEAAQRQAADAARKQADALVLSVESALAAVTADAGRAAIQAINDQADALERQVLLTAQLDAATRDRLLHEIEQTRELKKLQAEASAEIKRADLTIQSVGLSGQSPNDLLAQLMTHQQALLAQKQAIVAAGGDDSAINKELLQIEKARLEIAKLLFGVKKDFASTAEEETRRVTETARAIQQAVDGALQLADAFGLVGHSTTNILRSIGQMVAQVPVLMKAIGNFKSNAKGSDGNPLASIGTIIGAALPVAGAVATLVSAISSIGEASAETAKRIYESYRHIEDTFDSLSKPLSLARTGNSLDARAADLHSSFDDARRQVEEDFAGKSLERTREQFLSQLNDLEGERLELLKQQYAEEQKHLQEEYQVRLLRAEGFTTEADAEALAIEQQREMEQAIANGADATTLAALAAAQHAEALKAEADAQAAAAEAARKAIEMQEDFQVRYLRATGRDAEADALEFKARQQREYDQAVRDGADDATLAALKQAQLAEAEQFTAQQALAAAQALYQEAENQFNQDDDVLGKTPTEQATERAGKYGFDLSGFNLTTPEGVAAAVAYLQDIYRNAGDQTTKDEVQSVIHALRAIQFDETGGGAETGAAAARSGDFTTEVRQITVEQADKIGSLLASILAVLRQANEGIQSIRNAIASVGSTVLTPPQIPLGLFAGAGPVTITMNIQQVFNGPVGAETRAAAAGLSRELIALVDRELAKRFKNAKLLSGDVTQS